MAGAPMTVPSPVELPNEASRGDPQAREVMWPHRAPETPASGLGAVFGQPGIRRMPGGIQPAPPSSETPARRALALAA